MVYFIFSRSAALVLATAGNAFSITGILIPLGRKWPAYVILHNGFANHRWGSAFNKATEE
jgi:hypothetical protein